jgi:hypothetical protein
LDVARSARSRCEGPLDRVTGQGSDEAREEFRAGLGVAVGASTPDTLPLVTRTKVIVKTAGAGAVWPDRAPGFAGWSGRFQPLGIITTSPCALSP